MLMAKVPDSNEARLEYISSKAARDGPFHAEVVPAQDPHWYAVQTAPGHENVAAAHLAGRRFGVFVPTFIEPGSTKRRVLFPRHIFVFVWDVLKHWRRIHACPGVVGVLTLDERPIVVSDAAIERMHMIELKGLNVFDKPAKRRRGRRYEPESVVTISCYSALEGIEGLDDKARVCLLRKALGL